MLARALGGRRLGGFAALSTRAAKADENNQLRERARLTGEWGRQVKQQIKSATDQFKAYRKQIEASLRGGRT
jgi:hypothetical protein